VIVFERTDGDDILLFVNVERLFDDNGARFSFCNSFKWDLPLIIVELNWDEVVWEVWWSDILDGILGVVVVVVIDDDDEDDDKDERSSSSANSHKLTLANVEQSFWRSNNKGTRF